MKCYLGLSLSGLLFWLVAESCISQWLDKHILKNTTFHTAPVPCLLSLNTYATGDDFEIALHYAYYSVQCV